MAISLSDLKQVRATRPPRIIIYGVQGIGKTSLAASFPNPVFLQAEEGTPGDLELTSFGEINNYDTAMEALGALYEEDHNFKTMVLDTLDAFEPMVWAKTCAVNKWDTIESPDYGKGYVAADEQWRQFLEGVNALRRERNMCTVLIAHCIPERFEDPVIGTYNKYALNLHKRGSAILQHDADVVLFANYAASLKKIDAGFNKKTAHAEGGGQRFLYSEERPAFRAKNRYSMPPLIPYKKGDVWEALVKYFPGFDDSEIASHEEAA